MKLADPLALKLAQPKEAIVFAASQLQGERETQEDYFLNFNDECFVIADGVGGLPHGEVAAKLATETAIWAYKHVRQRRFYWLDKKLFIQRIFRSTNITLWQKQRESAFAEGLATTMVVVIVGEKNFWVGSVGDSSAWLLREGSLRKLTVDDVDEAGMLTKVLGRERYGLVSQFVGDRFGRGDTLLLVTDGITGSLSPEQLQSVLVQAGTTTKSLTDAVVNLLTAAQHHGSTDNMTACLIKRIAND